MGESGYDWVAVDLEHGAISVSDLPDIFRALELGGTLPLARVGSDDPYLCKQALDAGAGGVIVPMIRSAAQLAAARDVCRWPPAGRRGVGFSRANLYGTYFDAYRHEAQAPLLIAMIEDRDGVATLADILAVGGLDAVFVGPYDLSASLGCTGDFDDERFTAAMAAIPATCARHGVPSGLHVVQPDQAMLSRRLDEGYQFIAYSIDSVFLATGSRRPR
jgi:2-dehydro-3-deoxyglucarate aldolase